MQQLYTILIALIFVIVCVAGVLMFEAHMIVSSEKVELPPETTEMKKEESACWLARTHILTMIHVYNVLRVTDPSIPKIKTLDLKHLRKVLPLVCQIEEQRTTCPNNGTFSLSPCGNIVCSIHHPKVCNNKLNLKLCQKNMLSIRMALEAFKNKNNTTKFWDSPSNSSALIEKGIMKKLPKCPSGGSYCYNIATEIVECDVHGELKIIAEEIQVDSAD